jgi:hypothetical protein
MLKITRAADPITVERLNMVIYGPPGIAKTSLAFTADAPLLFDFDRGAHRAANRKDSVPVETWQDVAEVTGDDLAPFKTVVVDTAGRALDILTADIIRINPKLGRGGALTLQGYGELKARFIAFLKQMNGFGKDVVIIAHMDEQRNGDEIIERLDVQGGSKGEIYKAADAMGRLVIEAGQRMLKFSPTDAAFGKNPGQLPPLKVPHFEHPDFDGFLGRVIADTKARLNELTADQKAAADEQTWFRTTLPTIAVVDEINGLIERAKTGGKACSTLLNARATELGFTYDKTAGGYVVPPKAEANEKQKEAA